MINDGGVPPAPGTDESLFDGDPIPLTMRVPTPAFPVDALPKPIAEMVTTTAEATQTDPAMAGACGLSTLSACNGGHAEIEIRDMWREPLNTFIVSIALPGERKSAVQQAMVRALFDVEQQLVEQGVVARMEAETRRQVADEAATKQKRAAAGKANTAQWDTAMADAIGAAKMAAEIEVPTIPRLVANDATPEALASLLADQHGRLAIISAEGGPFDIMAGRYSGNIPNLDVYLMGHAGDRIRIDRKGRKPEDIPRPALTLGLMIQPDVLTTIAANRSFRGRGLLARFLYAYPVSMVGHRTIAPKPPDRLVVAAYETAIRDLAAGMSEWASDPAVLVLTPAAHEAMLAIERAVEPTLADDGELGALKDWGSKYVGGVIARIAGNIHLAAHGPETGPTTPVSAETIRQAHRIAEYFKACAINAFTEMGTDRVTADAAYLLDRINRLCVDELSERDMQRAARRFRKKDDLMAAVRRLVDHGYLAPAPVTPKREQGGRPASPCYRVWRS